MLDYLDKRNKYSLHKWKMRVGIHCGEVIAGVVGKLNYTYDIWGQSVTIAKYLERNGVPGKINISQSVRNLLTNAYIFNSSQIIGSVNTTLDSYFVSKAKVHS